MYELAIMVANGFAGNDKRFEEIDGRFDEMDKRFDRLEYSIGTIDCKVNEIDMRLKKVENALEPLLMGYNIMQKEMQGLNFRIERLEKKAGVAKK